MGRIWTERDGGGEARLFQAEGTAQARRDERPERWGVFGAQRIVSVDREGEEVEDKAAKPGQGHIIRGLECQGKESQLMGRQ